MQYVISVMDDGVGEAAPGEREAISAFNQRLFAGGKVRPFP